jgi:hypothetical protein
MKMTDIPFSVTDWSTIEPTEHSGETGKALWRTRQLGEIRVRIVDYSPGYRGLQWPARGSRKGKSQGSLQGCRRLRDAR